MVALMVPLALVLDPRPPSMVVGEEVTHPEVHLEEASHLEVGPA